MHAHLVQHTLQSCNIHQDSQARKGKGMQFTQRCHESSLSHRTAAAVGMHAAAPLLAAQHSQAAHYGGRPACRLCSSSSSPRRLLLAPAQHVCQAALQLCACQHVCSAQQDVQGSMTGPLHAGDSILLQKLCSAFAASWVCCVRCRLAQQHAPAAATLLGRPMHST